MARTDTLLRHFESRDRVRGFAVVVALGAALASAPPPEPSLEGLGALLGASVRGSVDGSSIAWEPRRNLFAELAFGRRVLFLARQDGGPRDLYRASVRLTPGGQPLAVASVENLTRTPDADELGLAVEGDVATFVTVALERIQAATVLEVGARSIHRADIVFDVPVREATLERGEGSLGIHVVPGEADVSYTKRGLVLSDPSIAHLVVRTPSKKRLALAFADGARATLGEGVFRRISSAWARAVDLFSHGTYALTHVGRRPEAHGPEPRAQVLDARSARKPEDVWPPPRVTPWLDRAEPGEGSFRPLAPRSGEPYLVKTSVRPDPSRPYARAIVVAMDMRKLELGMVAGREVPEPTTGPSGEGRLRGDREALGRIVAVFGGGRAANARFGMQAGGRLLAPPENGAVTISELAHGETLLGPWAFGKDVPSELVAFRQGLTSLLDQNGRPRAAATSDARRRAGLCATPAGHLYYAFGESLDERSLAATFSRAGCAYAVELGGGGDPMGLALSDIESPDEGHFTLTDPAMTLDPETVLRGSSRDFFYVSLRDLKPELPAGATWVPDAGTQPVPASITGIFHTTLPMGGLSVDLYAFEGGRVEWRLRPGVREPSARGEPWAGFLADDDRARALAVLEVGHTTVTPRLGLALGTTTPISLKDSFATLVLAPTEPPRILLPGESVKLRADEQGVQLPLLASADGVTERARDRGDLRMRSAFGVTRSGRVLVGLLRHDSSDPLAVALVNAGAERVVELDRGSHHPAFIRRAGTETPPGDGYESTTLWALGRPMLPGARVSAPP